MNEQRVKRKHTRRNWYYLKAGDKITEDTLYQQPQSKRWVPTNLVGDKVDETSARLKRYRREVR